MHVHNTAISMIDVNRDKHECMNSGYRVCDVGLFPVFHNMYVVPFIVDEGIKWHINSSQCPILVPCFFYKPYISLFNTRIFHSLVSKSKFVANVLTRWLIIDHIKMKYTLLTCSAFF